MYVYFLCMHVCMLVHVFDCFFAVVFVVVLGFFLLVWFVCFFCKRVWEFCELLYSVCNTNSLKETKVKGKEGLTVKYLLVELVFQNFMHSLVMSYYFPSFTSLE